uniref:Uncharacterized protein n=1 Tax=Triticum urartu TaxID=4572 RepID=A0A8R7TGE4_TRIUA
MVCGFISLLYFSVAQIVGEVGMHHCVVFTKVLCVFAAVLQIFGFGQDACFSWPGYMFSWLGSCFSASQHAYSVGQDTCFSWPGSCFSAG